VNRYARQILVAEVGETGQERLAQATVALSGAGLAHRIACAYAERAGVGKIVSGPLDETALAPSFVMNPANRAVVAGARAALAAMRAVLLPGGRARP
jgi:hypothetical protein